MLNFLPCGAISSSCLSDWEEPHCITQGPQAALESGGLQEEVTAELSLQKMMSEMALASKLDFALAVHLVRDACP